MPGANSDLTLYQRLLGDDYVLLPPVLQEFHSRPNGGEANGILNIERRPDLLRRTLANLLALPPAGKVVPLTLKVIPEGNRERWIRHFGCHRLETIQWQEGEYLIEKAGVAEFVFRVTASRQGLAFTYQHNRVGTLRVPPLLSTPVNATANGNDGCWTIKVDIHSALLGRLTTYTGEITPTATKE